MLTHRKLISLLKKKKTSDDHFYDKERKRKKVHLDGRGTKDLEGQAPIQHGNSLASSCSLSFACIQGSMGRPGSLHNANHSRFPPFTAMINMQGRPVQLQHSAMEEERRG